MLQVDKETTLGPTYNEHLAIMSIFLCIKIIESNVKKFPYNEHKHITSGFFCIFLLVLSGAQCKTVLDLSLEDSKLLISVESAAIFYISYLHKENNPPMKHVKK